MRYIGIIRIISTICILVLSCIIRMHSYIGISILFSNIVHLKKVGIFILQKLFWLPLLGNSTVLKHE